MYMYMYVYTLYITTESACPDGCLSRVILLHFRSSNTLYATRHKRKRPHLHSNSGAVAMDTIVPLRRSKREKRLLFSNLNQQEIYQHLANPHYSVIDDFSDVRAICEKHMPVAM